MDTILHAVEIEAPAKTVFEAISTAKGLSGWWSTKVTAKEELGGIVDFTFGGDFNPDMEITELASPTSVKWKCVAGHAPWLGSSFSFQIEPDGDSRSRLLFTQSYGAPIDDFAYGTYNYNWGYYMHSLKEFAETGKGFPHRP